MESGGVKNLPHFTKLHAEKNSMEENTNFVTNGKDAFKPSSAPSAPSPSASASSASGIPKEWAHLSSVGSVIPGSRFICFKTPFDHPQQYPKDVVVFTSKHLMEQMEEKKVPLGMVVDLTDSERYYAPVALEASGLVHLKIRIPGNAIPKEGAYKLFRDEVDKFLNDPAFKNKLVGVHCTHGINRTGWFVCRYLMEKKGLSADEAVEIFSAARGHQIHRPYLVNDLLSRCKTRTKGAPHVHVENRHSLNDLPALEDDI